MPPRRTAPKANEKLVVRPRRGQEGRAPAAPFIVQRTHQENQERAYVAASRRTDRGLHARMESARRASAIHKERTGRGFRITEEDVMNEEMYEEEDDDSTVRFEELRDDMSGTAQRFRQQLSDYVLSMEPQNPSVYLPEMGQHNLSPGGQARQTEIIDDYRVGQLRAAQWQQIHETSDGIYRTAHPVAVEFQTLRAERQQLPSEIRLDEMRRQQTEHMRALGHEGYVPTSLPEQLYPTAASYSPRPIRHPLDPDPMAQNPMAQHPMAQHTMARHPMAPHPMDPHPRAHYRMAQQPVQRGAWPSSIRYSPYGARGLPHPQQEPPATLDITPLDYIIDADFDSGFIGPRSRYVPYFEPAVGNSVSTAAAETAGPNGTSTGPNSSNIPGPFESGSTSPPSMGDETSFFPGLFSDTPGSPFASNFGDPTVNNEPELQENKPEQTENEATSDPGTFFRDPPPQVRSQIPSSTPAPNPVAPGELGATPDSDGLADLVEPQTGKFWYTAEEWDMTFDGEL